MIKKIILSPFQKFVKIESFSGILLFSAAIIALVWANSPFSESYYNLWQYEIGLSFQDFELKKPIILWINDGLMAIFFFLIGLELKRELLIGEINTIKKAAFPIIAAIGGVLIPISLYLLLNQNPDTENGWGIPMATDIAFALAILSLLGKRVPLNLKLFLTAFAIIDDIAAVFVIAAFYSESINWTLILVAGLLLGFLLLLSYNNKYSKGVFIVVAIIVWFLFLKSGLHPTIAGVLLAFTIPIRKKVNMDSFTQNLNIISDRIIGSNEKTKGHLLSKSQIEAIDNLEDWSEKVRSPLQHLEHKLHSWAAYVILPVFAFSNAGVSISGTSHFDISLLLNISLSLFLGKFIGVVLLSWLGIKFKIAELPPGVQFRQILGIAAIAGVGFTMSIFISNLAFQHDSLTGDSAKVGIILGSFVAGLIGYLILYFTGKNTSNINTK